MALWTVIVAICGGIILLGTAWKTAPSMWALTKAVGRVPESMENLAKVSTVADLVYAEFSSDNGSMRAAVDRLDLALTEILAWQQTHTVEDHAQNAVVSERIAEALDLIIERTSVLKSGLTEPMPLSEYTQDMLHSVVNAVTGVTGHIPLIHDRLDKLEQLLKDEHVRVEASQVETRTQVAEVMTAVRTMNDLTMGQMADADESRRIAAVDSDDRTAADIQHIKDVPPPSPAP